MIFDEDKCMNNSYQLITGKKSVEEFLEYDGDLYFIHNPDDLTLSADDYIFDQLIDYFIYTEEYEKCGEILELKELSKMMLSN